MSKHVSVRFAWHDSKWNGRICKRPIDNIDCRGNYSLLSPRIQKRIRLDLEDKYKGKPVSELVSKEHYVPPCYWSINALGEADYRIFDTHPFDATKKWGTDFRTKVKELDLNLGKSSVFTWCFQLGYPGERSSSSQQYVAPDELQNRVKAYTSQLVKGKSISFFYANYSNPLTDDDYRYLLLGAGLVDSTESDYWYKIPKQVLEDVRRAPSMKNFPEQSWQIQLHHDPKNTFVLPYQEYVEWLERVGDGIEAKEKWKIIDEIVIPIKEGNMIPNFKYVSMHVNHDKAIYLLYLLRKSVRKMKDHDIPGIERDTLKTIEDKIGRLLTIAWTERSEYPGFENALWTFLTDQIDPEYLEDSVRQTRAFIERKQSIQEFFKAKPKQGTFDASSESGLVQKAAQQLLENFDQIKFLSRFDFSRIQFKNVRAIINQEGFLTIKVNPYRLLEKYYYDPKYSWNIDESDYGISIYQIDIALIPDPPYVNWTTQYSPDSPERIRAVVSKVLLDSFLDDGSSCLTIEEVLKEIEKYPLFYINQKLKPDVEKLREFQKSSLFKSRFSIQDESWRGGPTLYQLNSVRDIEQFIQEFVEKMLPKVHSLPQPQLTGIEELVKRDMSEGSGKGIIEEERRALYTQTLSNGFHAILGKAGSGKTSGIVNLIDWFNRNHTLPLYVFTSTGKANLVIRDRIRKLNLPKSDMIRVSTVHRFLYSAIFESLATTSSRQSKEHYQYQDYGITHEKEIKDEAKRVVGLISKLLSGNLEQVEGLIQASRNFRWRPKVVIIDEISMVDEPLLFALLTMIDPGALEHFIVVGDERQLPPIGGGRAFVDIISYLQQKEMDKNYVRLQSNLRFQPSSQIGFLAELFAGEAEPATAELERAISLSDRTFEIQYFDDDAHLKKILEKILRSVSPMSKTGTSSSLAELFADIFDQKVNDKFPLDTIQILSPRRAGSFGSTKINTNIVKGADVDYGPRTKLICEANQNVPVTINQRDTNILALANGSIGYVDSSNQIIFDDLEDFKHDYAGKFDWSDIYKIRMQVQDSSLGTERDIGLGYALTVHKAQGSDFKYVIFVISEYSPFLTRELLYTAFTRLREKMFLLVKSDLKPHLVSILSDAYINSAIEKRRTRLFGYRESTKKLYLTRRPDGTSTPVQSKIEQAMLLALDKFKVNPEYEPKDFYNKYRIKPDFKITFPSGTYYWEHLGSMKSTSYRERNLKKLEIYRDLGIEDNLVTTSESDVISDVEGRVYEIVQDMMSGQLKGAGGYGKHHYEI